LIGADILDGATSPLLKLSKTIILTHHEKWDGTGYPNGLKGEDIPLVGRIVAMVDVFDALVTERPYKPAYPFETVVNMIKEQRGKHFDPKLVDLFLKRLDKIKKLQVKYAG
jgi:putative two-component system response regulator